MSSHKIRRREIKVDPDNALGPKVVYQSKYSIKKLENPNMNRVNVADGILAVLNKSVGNKFIRDVWTTKPNKPPSIILYTDQQQQLLKNAIKTGNVIGIDRTFNLNSCFLTNLCFKNTKIASNLLLYSVRCF